VTSTVDAEQATRRMLARGDLISTREFVRTIPPDERSLGLRILDAAAAIRLHEMTLGELDALRDDAYGGATRQGSSPPRRP